jgi:hypothetical protein
LRFSSERRFYDTNTPLFFQIGPFSQDFLFEIVREPVLAHELKIAVLPGIFNQPGPGLQAERYPKPAFLLLVSLVRPGADERLGAEVVQLLGCADAEADGPARPRANETGGAPAPVKCASNFTG